VLLVRNFSLINPCGEKFGRKDGGASCGFCRWRPNALSAGLVWMDPPFLSRTVDQPRKQAYEVSMRETEQSRNARDPWRSP